MNLSSLNPLRRYAAGVLLIAALAAAGCGSTPSHTHSTAPKPASSSGGGSSGGSASGGSSSGGSSGVASASGIPQGANAGDADSDNHGGPSDGDGNL